MEYLISSIITGGISLIGIIITSVLSNKEIAHKLAISQATMNTKLDALAEDVRQHSSGVQKIPVLEEKISGLERRIQALEER